MLIQPLLTCLILFSKTFAFGLSEDGLNPNTGLNMTELVTKYDYPIKTHKVQTEDGYILTIFRIPHSPNSGSQKSERPPILLMHGLLSSSADWVNTGPEKGLGFILADAGYDVWLGNQRGNIHSREHISLDIDEDKEKFFNFTFHEIGYYDNPATIDYILDKTQNEKLLYIGHSQGTTVFFVMTSDRPEYNEKIQFMAALAPVTYITNVKSPFIRFLADNYEGTVEFLSLLNWQELLPYNEFYLEVSKWVCNGTGAIPDVCTSFVFLLTGSDVEQWDPTLMTVISSNGPAGASSGQLKHFLQVINAGRFQHYDFGSSEENWAKYGREEPSVYDLTKVTAPVALYCGQNDWLSNITDVQQMVDELPNLVLNRVISYPDFNHVDFIWSTDVVQLLYNDLLDDLKNYLSYN